MTYRVYRKVGAEWWQHWEQTTNLAHAIDSAKVAYGRGGVRVVVVEVPHGVPKRRVRKPPGCVVRRWTPEVVFGG